MNGGVTGPRKKDRVHQRDYIPPPTCGVGDVNSDAKGSGARYNDGKTMVQYIPARVIRQMYDAYPCDDTADLHQVAMDVLDALTHFEERYVSTAIGILGALDAEHVWDWTGAQFHFGAEKYKAWNWAKGMAWSIPIACIKRHCIAMLNGEELDPESGVPHAGAIGCNAVMLVHYTVHFKEGDDRPPKEVFNAE